MAKRHEIPKEALNEVLLRSRRRCCICYDEGSQKPIEGNLARLVAVSEATGDTVNTVDNLVYLCVNHHAKYRRGGISTDVVRDSRNRLTNLSSGSTTSGTGKAAVPGIRQASRGHLETGDVPQVQ